MTDLKRKKKIDPAPPGACVLCKSEEKDEFLLGKFHSTPSVSVHYYCILFACGLVQNGRPSRDGIEGFLFKDILQEVSRGVRLKCCYCGLNGATVGCSIKKCPRSFHLPCGLKHGSLSQFFGRFCTYCETHKPKQFISKTELIGNISCTICYGAIEKNNRDSFLKASCCASNFFHRKCIQLYALSAGYFFKCTLCNDKKQFKKEMLEYGIHIPQQDASWEKEQNAYQELLVRAKCDAKNCLCPKGRQENKEHSKWHLVYCEDCGSTARHIGCETQWIQKTKKIWKCSDCVKVNEKLVVERKIKSLPNLHLPSTSSESYDSQNINQSVKELLRKCKKCFVNVELLQFKDLPANVRKKYKHRRKRIGKIAIPCKGQRVPLPTKPLKVERSKLIKKSKKKVQSSDKHKKMNNKIVSSNYPFLNSKENSEYKNKLSEISSVNECNQISSFYQKKNIKQTLINRFFVNKDDEIKTSVSKNCLDLVPDTKEKTCLFNQVQEVTYSNMGPVIGGAPNTFYVVRRRKTTNFYLKASSTVNSLLKQKLGESWASTITSAFNQQNYHFDSKVSQSLPLFPPLPMLMPSKNTENHKAACTVTDVKKQDKAIDILKQKEINYQKSFRRLSTLYKQMHTSKTKCISKFKCMKPSKNFHTYIDKRYIENIRLQYNAFYPLMKGIRHDLKVVLDDCSSILGGKTFCKVFEIENNVINSQPPVGNKDLSLVKSNESKMSENKNVLTHQSKNFVSNLQTNNVEFPSKKSNGLISNFVRTKIFTIDPMRFYDQISSMPVLPKMDDLSNVKNEESCIMPMLSQAVTPVKNDSIDVNNNNSILNRMFTLKNTHTATLGLNLSQESKQILTSKTKDAPFSKSSESALSSKILPNIKKENVQDLFPKQTENLKISMTHKKENNYKKQIESNNAKMPLETFISNISTLNPCGDKEKRKRKSRSKAEQISKRPCQRNTLLSYFFTL